MRGRELIAIVGNTRAIIAAIVLIVLGIRITANQSPVDWIMYAATWVTILHLCMGAFLFVRLGAKSTIHQSLECVGLLCTVIMVWCFTKPMWWCVALAVLMAVAIARYALIYLDDKRPAVLSYALEKLWSETPAIPVMVILAIYFYRISGGGHSVLYLGIIVLASTTLFAFWMVIVRRIYGRLLISGEVIEQ